MRKMVIAFVSAFGLIAVGLIILLVYAISQGGFHMSSGSFGMKLVNTENVDLGGIDKITLSYSSENVDILTSDTDELIFKEYMNYTPNDNELSQIKANVNELTIKSGRNLPHFSWPLNRNCRVEIYLPSGYSGELTVETSSGNINSDPILKLSGFTAESTSGNIDVHEVYSDSIRAKASSGNITFKLAEGKREFTATSGNIRVLGGSGDSDLFTSSGNITVENASGILDAEASSGEMRFINCAGGGTFSASSGNITLEFTSLTESLKAHASSGNINLTVPGTAAFNFNAQTSSGDIRSFFDDQLSFNRNGHHASGSIGQNPVIEVNLEASSGNIRVSD